MTWDIVFSSETKKEQKKILSKSMRANIELLLDTLRVNPFQNPPPYEKLSGNLKWLYSRRINVQHRLVYQVLKKERTVKVLSMWTHYEE